MNELELFEENMIDSGVALDEFYKLDFDGEILSESKLSAWLNSTDLNDSGVSVRVKTKNVAGIFPIMYNPKIGKFSKKELKRLQAGGLQLTVQDWADTLPTKYTFVGLEYRIDKGLYGIFKEGDKYYQNKIMN